MKKTGRLFFCQTNPSLLSPTANLHVLVCKSGRSPIYVKVSQPGNNDPKDCRSPGKNGWNPLYMPYSVFLQHFSSLFCTWFRLLFSKIFLIRCCLIPPWCGGSRIFYGYGYTLRPLFVPILFWQATDYCQAFSPSVISTTAYMQHFTHYHYWIILFIGFYKFVIYRSFLEKMPSAFFSIILLSSFETDLIFKSVPTIWGNINVPVTLLTTEVWHPCTVLYVAYYHGL